MSSEGIRKNPSPPSWGSFDLVVETENEQQTNKYGAKYAECKDGDKQDDGAENEERK